MRRTSAPADDNSVSILSVDIDGMLDITDPKVRANKARELNGSGVDDDTKGLWLRLFDHLKNILIKHLTQTRTLSKDSTIYIGSNRQSPELESSNRDRTGGSSTLHVVQELATLLGAAFCRLCLADVQVKMTNGSLAPLPGSGEHNDLDYEALKRIPTSTITELPAGTAWEKYADNGAAINLDEVKHLGFPPTFDRYYSCPFDRKKIETLRRQMWDAHRKHTGKTINFYFYDDDFEDKIIPGLKAHFRAHPEDMPPNVNFYAVKFDWQTLVTDAFTNTALRRAIASESLDILHPDLIATTVEEEEEEVKATAAEAKAATATATATDEALSGPLTHETHMPAPQARKLSCCECVTNTIRHLIWGSPDSSALHFEKEVLLGPAPKAGAAMEMTTTRYKT